MRSLTQLEALFLTSLRDHVSRSDEQCPVVGVFVTTAGLSGPALQIGLRLRDEPGLLYFNVLIYGTRPVRYHLECRHCSQAGLSRPFWNSFMGALNLVVEKSGVKDDRFHLFYEVAYPDKELKRLGEK